MMCTSGSLAELGVTRLALHVEASPTRNPAGPPADPTDLPTLSRPFKQNLDLPGCLMQAS